MSGQTAGIGAVDAICPAGHGGFTRGTEPAVTSEPGLKLPPELPHLGLGLPQLVNHPRFDVHLVDVSEVGPEADDQGFEPTLRVMPEMLRHVTTIPVAEVDLHR